MTSSPSTRGFMTPGRIVAYIAALLAVGALGFAIWKVKQPPAEDAGPPKAKVAQHLATEHARPASDSKFTLTDLAKFPTASRDWLGQEVPLKEMVGEGVTFKAAGKCSVPGDGASVHATFDAKSGGRASLFLQKYSFKQKLEDGKAYTLAAPSGSTVTIVAWKKPGGIVYFIVGDSKPAADAMRTAIKAPEPTGAM